MADRVLVSIRLVKELLPIEGADRIQVAVVDGWRVVTKKGEFQPGDKCVYHEIDSWCPVKECYEFLRKSSYRKNDLGEGFRLKTIKLKGQISQGLILPLSAVGLEDLPLGTNVTDILGVKKYEAPIPTCLAGVCKGLFPSFITKTDQERCQNLLEYIENTWRGLTFEVTEKVDGSSCTIYFNKGDFGVCSRNLELRDTEGNALWQIARVYDLEKKMREYGKNIAIQGEILGAGIQSNPYRIKTKDYLVFDIFDIDKHRYLNPDERAAITAKFGLKNAPILQTHLVLNHTVDQLLDLARGKSILKDVIREGLVFKSSQSAPNGERISFKAINNDYLLGEV